MPIKRTHYEILGVPRTATREQIKKRYRQLVRKYHPDVAEDKAAARVAFLQISEAYQTLTNPDKRVIYDAEMDRQITGRTQQSARPGASSGAQSRPSASASESRSSQRRATAAAERFIRDAEAALLRGQSWVALDSARDAIRADHRSVRAHMILGDVYRMQNRMDEAASAYTVVLQLDPKNAEASEKLNKAMRRVNRSRVTAATAERMQAFKTGVSMVSGSIGVFLLILLLMSPGRPIPWLEGHMPFVASWSAMLIAVLLGAGALTGFVLSMTDGVRNLDEELVFQTVSAGRRVSYPIGLILVILNLFSFYVAAGIYLLAGVVQDGISRSVMKAFVATVCLLALIGMLYPSGSSQVLVWGGNLVFPALLFGWAVGDMVRPW